MESKVPSIDRSMPDLQKPKKIVVDKLVLILTKHRTISHFKNTMSTLSLLPNCQVWCKCNAILDFADSFEKLLKT